MRTKTVIALLGLLATPIAALAEEATPKIARPNLSGEWVVNEPLSETMREKVREQFESEEMNPRAQARWSRVQDRDRARMKGAQFSHLSIVHADPQLEITYLGGRVRALFTDGRELPPDEEYGVQSVTVTWEGARLVVDADTERGRLTEFWELSDDGKRLFVTTQLEMGERFSGPISFRRIYDLQPPEAEAPAPAEAEQEPGDPGL